MSGNVSGRLPSGKMANGQTNGRGDPPVSGKIKPEVLRTPRLGRPSEYTPEMADLICQRVRECGTLLEAVEKHRELPASPTIYRWLSQNEDFRAKYTRVREDVMEMWADEIVAVANDSTLEPNDRRIKIDTKKWLMSKIAYRRYGDKLIHSGDPDNPLQVMHKIAIPSALGPDELAALDLFTRTRLTITDAEYEEVPGAPIKRD